MPEAISQSLDRSLIESVKAALNAFGPSVGDSILSYLFERYSVSLEEIPEKIDEFVEAIYSLLGNGARVVEKLIIARLVETKKISMTDARGRNLAEVMSLANMHR